MSVKCWFSVFKPTIIIILLLILIEVTGVNLYNFKLSKRSKHLCMSSRFLEMSGRFSLCCELRSFILVPSRQQLSQQ